jgi:hypothetical protein
MALRSLARYGGRLTCAVRRRSSSCLLVSSLEAMIWVASSSCHNTVRPIRALDTHRHSSYPRSARTPRTTRPCLRQPTLSHLLHEPAGEVGTVLGELGAREAGDGVLELRDGVLVLAEELLRQPVDLRLVDQALLHE